MRRTPHSPLSSWLRLGALALAMGALGRTPAAPPPAATAAAGDQPVYADSFRSGWHSYGWAAIDPGNAAPVHGGTASLKIASNGFDGLHIHHSALDDRLYRALTFWINGGPTGGQRLRVAAYLGGAMQPAARTLGPLPPNTWQQVTIPLADLGVADRPDLDGIFLGNVDGVARPPYYVDDMALLAAPPPARTTVSVDARATLQTVDDRLFGVNTGAFEAAFPSHVPLLRQIDNRALRFPGGTLSDTYHWAANTTVDAAGVTAHWPLDFETFARAARATRSQVYLTVNYGTGTAQEAADWVRHANVAERLGFRYWEIGNECNLTAEPDQNVRPHDPFTYATRAADYIRRMKAVDPAIQIGVVIGGDEDGHDNGYHDHPATNPRTGQAHTGWDPVVLATLRAQGTRPDFVIYHRYVYLGGQEHDTSLLLSSRAWTTEIARIRRMLADYLGPGADRVEVAATEHGSTASAPGKQTTSLVNGLFLADSLGYAARTPLKALLLWQLSDDPQNPGNDPSLYGWRQYGGYGIMARVPTTDPKFEVYPTFYIYKLLTHFARGGDSVVAADSSDPLLSAHAARRADGSLSLLVINKDPAAARSAQIALAGFVPAPRAVVYSYGIPQDEAARTRRGSPDVARTTFTHAARTFSYRFPPYSATVIAFSAAGRTTF